MQAGTSFLGEGETSLLGDGERAVSEVNPAEGPPFGANAHAQYSGVPTAALEPGGGTVKELPASQGQIWSRQSCMGHVRSTAVGRSLLGEGEQGGDHGDARGWPVLGGSKLENDCLASIWSGSEEGSYFRLIHCCITQL